MGSMWGGFVVSGAVVAMGVATLRGWQASGYKRPRAAGWSAIAAGLGIGGAGLLVLLKTPDSAMRWWAVVIGGLLLLSLVLMVVGGPQTRLTSRRKRNGDR